MDPREHIGIGLECVTGMESAHYLGCIVENAVSVCVLMYQVRINFEFASVVINAWRLEREISDYL